MKEGASYGINSNPSQPRGTATRKSTGHGWKPILLTAFGETVLVQTAASLLHVTPQHTQFGFVFT